MNEICKNLFIRRAVNKDSYEIINLIFHIWTKEYNFKVKKEDFPDLYDIEAYYQGESVEVFQIVEGHGSSSRAV
jgi:hypothetical protein